MKHKRMVQKFFVLTRKVSTTLNIFPVDMMIKCYVREYKQSTDIVDAIIPAFTYCNLN